MEITSKHAWRKNLHVFLYVFVLFASAEKISAQDQQPWENPAINGINKERPHAFGFIADEKSNNPHIQSLNGIWKFKWSPDPQSRPAAAGSGNARTRRRG